MDIGTLRTAITRYAAGKSWYWYLPLWLVGAYAFWQLFQIDMVHSQLPLIWLVPYSFNFVMHEWAHIFTAFLPPVLTASAGSGSELLLGLILIGMAIWQRSYFALLFCAEWFALSCQSAGQYMADAVPQQLPLVSLGAALSGGEAKHDWHFVFGQLDLLPESYAIGTIVRVVGMLTALSALAFTAWLLYKMSQAPAWANAGDEAALSAALSSKSPLPAKPPVDTGFTSLPLTDPVSPASPASESRKHP